MSDFHLLEHFKFGCQSVFIVIVLRRMHLEHHKDDDKDQIGDPVAEVIIFIY